MLRAFRRPPSPDELADAREVYGDARGAGASFEDALALVAAMVLQSPSFLYLIEIGQSDEPVRRLTPYEVATRLSFLYWDGPPDQRLLDAARADALQTPEQLVAEATRMLGDPRAQHALRRFFREWLRLVDVVPMDRDPALHPGFDAEVSASMAESFDRYVTGSVARRASVRELLTSPSMPLDAPLAEYLGLPVPAGGSWTWSELDPGRQVGLMTQPLVMANGAHYDETSYVARGLTVLRQVLCQELGRPPADALARAEELSTSIDPSASQREFSRLIRESPGCRACHDRIDPAGLAFEHFDATGRWRVTDSHGNPIETADALAGPPAISFTDHRDLLETLADSGEASWCFSVQWSRFLTSTMEVEVPCRDDVDAAASSSIFDRLLAPVESESFLYRSVETNE